MTTVCQPHFRVGCRLCRAAEEQAKNLRPTPNDELLETLELSLFANPKQAPSQPRATSEAAAVEISKSLSRKRRDVLLWFLRNHMEDGATDNELIAALVRQGWSANTPRARRVELTGKWLEEHGERDGSTVWRPTQQALDWYENHLRGAAA